jgi:ATP-binding cassette subfamily B multidrug efflux pump
MTLQLILKTRLRWRLAILALALLTTGLGLLAPYLQREFIQELLHPDHPDAWLTLLGATTVTALALVIQPLLFWVAGTETTHLQRLLSDRLYSRLIFTRGGLVGRRPTGEAVSLFAVDVPGSTLLIDPVLAMGASVIFPILFAPFAVHALFGVPLTLTLGAIGATCFVSIALAFRQSRFFDRFKYLAQVRTGQVGEWIQNIKTLRILGWTRSAEEAIITTRKNETENRVAMVTNGQLMNAVASTSSYVVNILAIIAFTKINPNPKPGDLFALLWYLGIFLSRPLRGLPWLFVMGLDAWTSIRRVDRALAVSITPPEVLTLGRELPPLKSDRALEVLGLDLVEENRAILNGIDFDVREGEFLAIVGPVGSGKSQLLQSLVGETPCTFKRFAVEGRETIGPKDAQTRAHFGFVSQEGFTMSASLGQNVSFSYQPLVAEDPILGALQSSAFRLSNEGLPDGLQTEIGERGINLSGGQKQRVALARATYADRPILLLDDCLSAVDVATEKDLLDSLFLGAWKNKTRILVTHRMSVLPQCDRILLLVGGKISDQGTYAELLERSANFRELIHENA